jgi:hypothetical protein
VNERHWEGVRSFVANDVAKNEATRSSTHSLYSPVAVWNNVRLIHAAFHPGKRCGACTDTIGVDEMQPAADRRRARGWRSNGTYW